ncbi:MAG: hypothetical protein ACK4LQ_02235 [Pararhodobacter sp.]
MIGLRNLREPDHLPHASARRYFASGNRVICHSGDLTYLICTIERTLAGGDQIAEIVADALNRQPRL